MLTANHTVHVSLVIILNDWERYTLSYKNIFQSYWLFSSHNDLFYYLKSIRNRKQSDLKLLSLKYAMTCSKPILSKFLMSFFLSKKKCSNH